MPGCEPETRRDCSPFAPAYDLGQDTATNRSDGFRHRCAVQIMIGGCRNNSSKHGRSTQDALHERQGARDVAARARPRRASSRLVVQPPKWTSVLVVVGTIDLD